jgi:hypothetical protein
MPSNDREIWVSIVSGNTHPPELNYLTYAIYSFEKYEWYDQIEKVKGKSPTPDEINEWISQITETRIKAWRESSARTFDLAARAYMKDYLVQERQTAINDRVIASVQSSLDNFSVNLRGGLAELRKASSFRNQLLIGFVIAILSPIILGVVILAVQAADLWPTPTGVTHIFQPRQPGSPATGAVHSP